MLFQTLNLSFDKKKLELIICAACLAAFRWVHLEMAILSHVNAQLYLTTMDMGAFYGKILVRLDA